jgi:hypothetical protein
MLRIHFSKQLVFCFLASLCVMGFVCSLDPRKDDQEGTVCGVVNALYSKALNCMTVNRFSHKMFCTVKLEFGIPSVYAFLYSVSVLTSLQELW